MEEAQVPGLALSLDASGFQVLIDRGRWTKWLSRWTSVQSIVKDRLELGARRFELLEGLGWLFLPK